MATDSPLTSAERRALRLGSEPAEPCIQFKHVHAEQRQHLGLSKRELLAGMAMQGLLSRGGDASYPGLALVAVKYADALLEELAK